MQYVVRSHLPVGDFPLITKAADWPVFFASAMYVFEGIALVCNQMMITSFWKLKFLLGLASSTKNERTSSVW